MTLRLDAALAERGLARSRTHAAVLIADGVVTVKLSNGNGLSLEQALNVPVRPAAMPITTRRPIEIAANGSLTIDDQLLADSQLAGASVSLSVSRAAALTSACSKSMS